MALAFKPEDLPVLGLDSHLPAVTAASLVPAALRARFAAPPAWQPEITVERRFVDRAAAAASVLIAIVLRDLLTVLLTRRTDHLRDHAGQISFPGGRAEAHDADAVATALRETLEEVGLPADRVDVIGRLPVYTTVTNFVVTPVVGLVTPPFALALDGFEVAEAFEVPLGFLMTPAHHRRHAVEFEGARREFLSMPWRGQGADGVTRDYFIWGATAAMLRNLYAFLAR